MGYFQKTLTKKLRFLRPRSPSNLVNIGVKGAFRKILRSVSQNGYFKELQRGIYESAGLESLRGGAYFHCLKVRINSEI